MARHWLMKPCHELYTNLLGWGLRRSGRWRGSVPHRGHVVADGDGRHHDYTPSRCGTRTPAGTLSRDRLLDLKGWTPGLLPTLSAVQQSTAMIVNEEKGSRSQDYCVSRCSLPHTEGSASHLSVAYPCATCV